MALGVGVDPDQRSLWEHRAPALHRLSGLVEHLPFPDESFDLVICSWVLEHLRHPQYGFAEIARVLRMPNPSAGRPGGQFVFLTPNAWHPLTWINRLLTRSTDWQSRLVNRVYLRSEVDTFPIAYRANTRRRITRLAREVGLEPIAFHTIGDPTYLAFNELFYRLTVAAERLMPRWIGIHLVGDMRRSSDDPSR